MARFIVGSNPGWAVAQNLRQRLEREFDHRLNFSVYREYGSTAVSDNPQKEEYHVIATHPRTREIRFRRLIPVEELMSDEGYQLLMTQLYLVEPPHS